MLMTYDVYDFFAAFTNKSIIVYSCMSL